MIVTKINNRIILCWQHRVFQSSHSVNKNTTYTPSEMSFPLTFSRVPTVVLSNYNVSIILTTESITTTDCQVNLYNAHTGTVATTGYSIIAIGY